MEGEDKIGLYQKEKEKKKKKDWRKCVFEKKREEKERKGRERVLVFLILLFKSDLHKLNFVLYDLKFEGMTLLLGF